MIRVGIIGLGDTIGIARSHIKAYRLMEDVKVAALYDILPGRAQGYKDSLGLEDAFVCDSVEELLAQVDAVTICTPNASHIDLTVRALNAGKHVLCEKPFAPQAKDCEPALKAAEDSGLVSMIGLCYRGIPAMRFLKHLVDSGELGDIYYVRESQGGNRIANPQVKCEWRMQRELSGPGAIADFGSHMLDMTDYILRSKCGRISKVQCMTGLFVQQRPSLEDGQPKGVDNDDVGVFQLQMANGALVSCAASRIGADHTFEIFGSKGYAGFNGERPFELTRSYKEDNGGYKPGRETVPVPEFLYLQDPKTPVVPFEVNFYLQNREFIDAINGKVQTGTGFRRGVYVQRLIDALQQSAEQGQTVDTSGLEE